MKLEGKIDPDDDLWYCVDCWIKLEAELEQLDKEEEEEEGAAAGQSNTVESDPSRNAGSQIGAELVVDVEECHFGQARCRVTSKDPATMPDMLGWPKGKFQEYTLEVAEINFGAKGYSVWCAVGVKSNRLLYAMKRQEVPQAQATIVPAPAREKDAEDSDEELTFGRHHGMIQLVP